MYRVWFMEFRRTCVDHVVYPLVETVYMQHPPRSRKLRRRIAASMASHWLKILGLGLGLYSTSAHLLYFIEIQVS